MSTKTRKPRTPKAVTFEQAFGKLYDKPGLTRTDLGLNPVYVAELQKEGLIKKIGEIKTGERGRPAHRLALTDKARKRVQRQRNKTALESVAPTPEPRP